METELHEIDMTGFYPDMRPSDDHDISTSFTNPKPQTLNGGSQVRRHRAAHREGAVVRELLNLLLLCTLRCDVLYSTIFANSKPQTLNPKWWLAGTAIDPELPIARKLLGILDRSLWS